jgi:hypothetical protein
MSVLAILFMVTTIANEFRGEHRWELFKHEGKNGITFGIKEDGFDPKFLDLFTDLEMLHPEIWELNQENDSFRAIGMTK